MGDGATRGRGSRDGETQCWRLGKGIVTLSRVSRVTRHAYPVGCQKLLLLLKLCSYSIVSDKTREAVQIVCRRLRRSNRRDLRPLVPRRRL
jgi:hypothetical protein